MPRRRSQDVVFACLESSTRAVAFCNYLPSRSPAPGCQSLRVVCALTQNEAIEAIASCPALLRFAVSIVARGRAAGAIAGAAAHRARRLAVDLVLVEAAAAK